LLYDQPIGAPEPTGRFREEILRFCAGCDALNLAPVLYRRPSRLSETALIRERGDALQPAQSDAARWGYGNEEALFAHDRPARPRSAAGDSGANRNFYGATNPRGDSVVAGVAGMARAATSWPPAS
jgi:hypothetical protein